LKWHIAHLILHGAGTKYHDSLDYAYPTKYGGRKAIVFGVEDYPGRNIRMANTERYNSDGDKITIHDFYIINTRDFSYFELYPNRVHIILDIARGKLDHFGENDMGEIAEFIKLGYIRKNGDNLCLKFPVFTKEQFHKIKTLLNDATNAVVEKMREAVKISTDILIQHTPVSMKKDAENIGWLQARDCGFSSVKIMLDNGTLRQVADNAHPTMYIELA